MILKMTIDFGEIVHDLNYIADSVLFNHQNCQYRLDVLKIIVACKNRKTK
jgi:hypothetical protein